MRPKTDVFCDDSVWAVALVSTWTRSVFDGREISAHVLAPVWAMGRADAWNPWSRLAQRLCPNCEAVKDDGDD